MTHLTPKQWAAVKTTYVAGACGLPELARHYKISATTIYRHACRGDWHSQREAIGQPTMENDAETNRAGKECSDETAIQMRLFALLDRTLCEIEAALRTSQPRTASDRERDARTLGVIMRILEKLNDQKKSGDEPNQAAWLTRDDEAICRDVAKELAKFEREQKENIS